MELLESIGSQGVERIVQFRVKPDADLLSAIEEALAVEGIRSGAIVSGLGALKRAVFRNLKWFPESYPVKPEDRLYLEVAQPMELVSLTGWIAPKASGGVEVHAHFSASTDFDPTQGCDQQVASRRRAQNAHSHDQGGAPPSIILPVLFQDGGASTVRPALHVSQPLNSSTLA